MANYWLWTHGASGIVRDERAQGVRRKDHAGLIVVQPQNTENWIQFAIPTIAADTDKRYVIAEVMLAYDTIPIESVPLGQPRLRARFTEIAVFDGATFLAVFKNAGQERVDSHYWQLPEPRKLSQGVQLVVHIEWFYGASQFGNLQQPIIRFRSAGMLLTA